MSDFTKGPWDRIGTDVVVAECCNQPVCQYVEGPDGYPMADGSPDCCGQPVAALVASCGTEANAHLIAAAPELYETLAEWECTLELLERNGPDLTCADGEFVNAAIFHDRADRLRAALAKARGEKSA